MNRSIQQFVTFGKSGPGAAAVLCGVLLFGVASGAEQATTPDYRAFDVSRLDKPLEMDCATKHAKYLQAGDESSGLSGLPSISGAPAGDSHRSQARSRQNYSKHLVRYEAPDVMLTNADREMLELSSMLDTDQPVMLNFIFTTCTTICPVLSASFKQVQELLGDDADRVLMISVTIDPEYDTPDKLAGYAQRFGAGRQWQFLTGQLDDVIEVEKAFDIYRGSKTNHEPITLIRARRSSEWLRIEGFANAGDIVEEYRRLLDQEPPQAAVVDRLSQNADPGLSDSALGLVQ